MMWINTYCSGIVCDSLVKFAFVEISIASIVIGAGMEWVDMQCRGIVCDGVVKLTFVEISIAPIIIGIVRVRS